MVYNISLSDQALAYIGGILGKQPYGEVAQLIADIDKQVVAQNKQQEDVKESDA